MAGRTEDRRGRREEFPVRGMFLGFFLGGGALVFLVKALFSGWAPAFVAVVLLLVYTSLLVDWETESKRPRYEYAGDHVYYLGFLYTLISLAVSLYQFSGEGQASEIVSNFGIALVSTIVGLAGRILLAVPEEGPEEVEERTRLDLVQAARELRAQMEYSISEFQETVAEFRKARESAAAMLSDLNDNPVSVEPLRQAISDLGKAVADTSSEVGERQIHFRTRLVEVDSALAGVSQRLRSGNFQGDFEAGVIRPMLERLEGLLNESADVLREAFRRQAAALGENPVSLAPLTRSISDLEAAVAKASSEVGGRQIHIGTRLAKVESALDTVSRRLRSADFRADFEAGVVRPTAERLESLTRETTKNQEASRELHAQHVQAVGGLEKATARLQDVAEGLGRFGEQAERWNESAGEIVKRLGELERGLTRTFSQLNEVNRLLDEKTRTETARKLLFWRRTG